MAPEARSKFGTPMFEPKVFQKQMYCIEESTCDIVGTFRRLPQSFGAPPHSESADIEVMAEFLKILKPVSCALNKLQSEKNAYMGVLLPTLDILR